jgi:nucleoside 2-deoxyribosyltransferase
MKKIYLAGALFSIAEQEYNRQLRDLFEELGYNVLLPQERAGQHLPDLKKATEQCISDIDECDIIVATLDGPDADSGTAFEIGYGYAKGKQIFGIRTDFRLCESEGVRINGMLYYNVIVIEKLCFNFKTMNESLRNIVGTIHNQIVNS